MKDPDKDDPWKGFPTGNEVKIDSDEAVEKPHDDRDQDRRRRPQPDTADDD